ncbi:MAG: hypothetical protein IKC01_04430, partial [Clostridia bacterium]|nr:hypothetical protein [Clostridia bacterium]
MLHIIQGRSGSGKTYFIRNKIKEILNEGEFRPLLLVPDQFSFENERAMLSFLGAKNMTGVDVLSFPRLANSNLDSKVLQGKLFADDGVRMAYMSEALTQLSDDLKIFSKVRHNVSGLKSFIDFNKELKTCDVTGEDIEALVEKMPENLLKEKLSEINLINEAYNALLTRSYFDDTECLRYFNEFAADTHFFKNKIVFLDSFRAFSEQEFKCIRLALVQAQDVYISICTDETVRGESPFVYMNELKKKIISLANKCNVRIAPVVTLKYNDSFNKSIRHIEENIYCEESEIFNENSDGVTILKCNDITDECNVVALEIKKLIRSGKYRCKDIAVVERSSDKYKRIMCDVLTRYGVPVFDDSRRPLSFETLFIHVTSAVECITDGFKTESVMRYLKTGLSELSFEDVSTLEKYVLVWGINGSAWTTDFTMHPDGFGSEIDESVEKRINYLNELRKKAILPLLKMKKNCEGASGLDITKAVYDFLVDTKTSDKLYKLSVGLNAQGFPEEALRKETSWDVLIELLDTIAEITKDKYYTIKRWFELFSILVFSKDIGEIPQGLDEVKVGSADRIRTENLKVIFLVGVNKNEFPLIASVGGLLSDSDRRVLTNEMELKIRPAFEESVYEERFIAYCMLTAAKEKLYLSYREVSDDDSTGGASEII